MLGIYPSDQAEDVDHEAIFKSCAECCNCCLSRCWKKRQGSRVALSCLSIENLPEDTPLSLSVRLFLWRFNWGRKTHSESGELYVHGLNEWKWGREKETSCLSTPWPQTQHVHLPHSDTTEQCLPCLLGCHSFLAMKAVLFKLWPKRTLPLLYCFCQICDSSFKKKCNKHRHPTRL